MNESQVQLVASLERWRRFYREVFSVEVESSAMHVPPQIPEKQTLLLGGVVSRETLMKSFDGCIEIENDFLFVPKTYTMTSELKSIRPANGAPYVIWHKMHPDFRLRNRSGKELASQSVQGMTIEERLLLDRIHFFEHRNRLQTYGVITMCIGSRGPRDGAVPLISFRARKMHFNVAHETTYRNEDAMPWSVVSIPD